GLLAKRYEEHSNLAYQVHPLPDQILDYVWDYGVLKPSDEKIYINIMVKKYLEEERLTSKLFSELLFASQEFIRSHEGAHSVSLRDVKRAITLVKHFHKTLIKRPRPNPRPHRSYPQYPSPLHGMEKEFEEQDLIDTADRLFENNKAWSKRFNFLSFNFKKAKLEALANSYLEYEKKQPIDNFHGLRDYYSLLTPESIKMALARNFGGTNQMDKLYDEHFVNVLKAFNATNQNQIQFSAEDLIKANLKDKNARHLMLIGKSDSIVNILTYKLRYWNEELSERNDLDAIDNVTSWDLEPVVIYGSQFPDDRDDDYQYGVL
ncbi:5403_t:CDS:2, partial [Racocetra fulgida]